MLHGHQQCTGRATEEPFNEGAAQVRRLVQRDRKELLGNAADILDKYKTEFGNGTEEEAPPPPAQSAVTTAAPSSSSSPFGSGSSSNSSSSPFASGGVAASPFGGPAGGAASPFGGAATARPSRLASIEPKGLSPDMGPDPIVAPPKDTRSFLARITLTQVVLVLSFSTIIGLMIATFFVVVNTGAVRLAGID